MRILGTDKSSMFLYIKQKKAKKKENVSSDLVIM